MFRRKTIIIPKKKKLVRHSLYSESILGEIRTLQLFP